MTSLLGTLTSFNLNTSLVNPLTLQMTSWARYSIFFVNLGPCRFATCSLFRGVSTPWLRIMRTFGQPYPSILHFSTIFNKGLNKATDLLNTAFFAVALFRSASILTFLISKHITLLFSSPPWRHLGSQSGEAFRDVPHLYGTPDTMKRQRPRCSWICSPRVFPL